MTTQQHATLNLQTNDVLKLFNKNDLSIESTKQLLSERKPYDTKIYSHSRSRSDSQTSFVTNHSDVTTSINDNFQNNYKKLPGKLRTSHHISKYRKSLSTDSTKIDSLQLITPQSYSNTHNTNTATISNTPLSSRDRPLCGSSLIQQTRRHQFNKYKISVTPNFKQQPIANNNNNNKLNQRYKYNSNNNCKSKLNVICKPKTTDSNSNNANCFSLHSWLLNMDILKYKNIFINEGFDKLGSIVELQLSDLQEMNIPKGHCKMILRQVHNLQIKYQLNIKPIIKHQKQSYSDSIIPTIDKILSNDCTPTNMTDVTDNTSNISCGFPDIDSSVIDLKKIHNHNHNNYDNESIDNRSDLHTFPRTSTNTSPFPLNINIKNNNKALKPLMINIPKYSNNNSNKYKKHNKYNTGGYDHGNGNGMDKKFNYRYRQYDSNGFKNKKNKKKKRSKKKSLHYQSKSSPLMKLTAQKLFMKTPVQNININKNQNQNQNQKQDDSKIKPKKCMPINPKKQYKQQQQTNRIPWFLCGSNKNQMSNLNNTNQSHASQISNIDCKQSDGSTPEFIPTDLKSNSNSNTKSNGNNSTENRTLSISMEEVEFTISNVECREAKETLNVAKELHMIGNFMGAADKYAEFLHYSCNDVDARIRYALCLLELEQYNECKQQLDLLCKYDPINNNNNMLQFVYGLLYHKCNNFTNAIKHYNNALIHGYIYKDRIYNNLASLFRACKDYINAEKYQIISLNLNNKNYISYINYAKILTDMNRYNDACNAYTNAILLQPNLTQIYYDFAVFLIDIKQDYLLAAKHLNTAHKLEPNNTQINNLLKQAIQYCAQYDFGDSDYSSNENYTSSDNEDNDNNYDDSDYDSDNIPSLNINIENDNNIQYNKQRRLSISESLPPPHNPHNPNNPMRKQFIIKENDNDNDNDIVDDDDNVSVLSDLSDI